MKYSALIGNPVEHSISPQLFKILTEKLKIDLQVYPNLSKNQIMEWYSDIKETNNSSMYCDHVQESIRMRANGDITLCQYIDEFLGNVKDKNISSIIIMRHKTNPFNVFLVNYVVSKVFGLCLFFYSK